MTKASVRKDIMRLARVQLFTLIPFMLLKSYRQELIAAFPNDVWEVFLYSFPNFAEAIVGMMFLASAGVYLLHSTSGNPRRLPLVYLLATVGTLTYVITQELKWHSIGGENITDPWDVAFSVAGTIAGLAILFYLRPGGSVQESESEIHQRKPAS